MNILHYSENVYHQFFTKLDEVDFFLEEAIENEQKCSRAKESKDAAFFNKMQFLFSASMGALVSSWEIARLTIQLDNSITGKAKDHELPSEYVLAKDPSKFEDFFGVRDRELHYWFCFLKAARNASAHDGSCAVNGGNVEIFKFQSDLHRFEWCRANKAFKYSTCAAPQIGAVTSMLAMAYKLSPLFLSKLKRPDVSTEVGREIATFNINSTFHLKDISFLLKSQLIEGLIEARKSIPDKQADGKISKWESLYRSRFVWA